MGKFYVYATGIRDEGGGEECMQRVGLSFGPFYSLEEIDRAKSDIEKATLDYAASLGEK